MKVLVIYGSSRDEGNTELLSERVVEGLDCTRVRLREQNVLAIRDQRHAPGGFSPVGDDHLAIIQEMLSHDVIVFATPLYWYSMSGPMKDFIDRWSQSLRDERVTFKDGMKGKPAYVVVTGGPEARLKGLPLIQQFAHIFEFMGMKFVDYLIGIGGKPGDVLRDERGLSEAAYLNRALRRLAEETGRG